MERERGEEGERERREVLVKKILHRGGVALIVEDIGKEDFTQRRGRSYCQGYRTKVRRRTTSIR